MPKSRSFRERMRALSARMPPPLSTIDRALFNARLERLGETDVGFRLKLKALQERYPPFLQTRVEGGSGFIVSSMIRHFFLEYASRLARYGPYSFPTSFNVVESFLVFSERYLAFDIREEREHLLRLDDYLDWYTAGRFPTTPAALKDILPEGIVYAYDMLAPADDFAIETSSSVLRILGAGFVRHGSELSTMLIAGESPPFPSDNDAEKGFEGGNLASGREEMESAPTYTIKDRYVAELPGHSRVVVMGRFDLDLSRYDVRYVSLDIGTSYTVLTDDPTIYPDETRDIDAIRETMNERLARYSAVFSALASMLYLPAFVIDQGSRIVDTTFATALREKSTTKSVRDAIAILGAAEAPFFRTLHCLVGMGRNLADERYTVTPPDMEFHSSGYWRPIAPGSVGQSQDGAPILGKTWVERTESWSAQPLEKYVLARQPKRPGGRDPGTIYVVRSGSHFIDIYKIGLTRRTPNERATELSSATGVPTSFEVLATWDVRDCASVEAAIHRKLAPFRVNKRREFFKCSLKIIVASVEAIVRED